MRSRSKFISSEVISAWLKQFFPEDQQVAQEFLTDICFVTRDEFSESLRSLILRCSKKYDGMIGLYAERELKRRNGRPVRLFKESRKKIKRAYGVGPLAVEPVRRYDQCVGSEGIIAQLITEISRQFKEKFLSHPGPDQIRNKKVRRFFLITDFIGSGRRVNDYLESAYRVRTVKSWVSSRQDYGIRFDVLSYAATKKGKELVEHHGAKPETHIVRECCTISDIPDPKKSFNYRRLCEKYNPYDGKKKNALGYNGVGALIAFAHGIPNDAPRMLYCKGKNWLPLFPARVTAKSQIKFTEFINEVTSNANTLISMGNKNGLKPKWLKQVKYHFRKRMLTLAMLTQPPRDDQSLMERTGLVINDLNDAIWQLFRVDWIDERRRPTDLGLSELKNFVKTDIMNELTSKYDELLYYPSSLRAPMMASSKCRCHRRRWRT